MAKNKDTDPEYRLGTDGLPLIPEKKIRGCPERAAISKEIALDAHKLIAVLERMESDGFTISLPRAPRDYVFKELLSNVFKLSKNAVDEIFGVNMYNDDGLHRITFPRELRVSDFHYIPATKEIFYQDLTALQDRFGKQNREHLNEVVKEIRQIKGIMNDVLGIQESEKLEAAEGKER